MYGDNGSAEEGPLGTFETYRAEGEQLYKNGEYRKAIESFSTVGALPVEDGAGSCFSLFSCLFFPISSIVVILENAESSMSSANLLCLV